MADSCNPITKMVDMFWTIQFQQNLGWFFLVFTTGFFYVSVSSYIVTLEGPCV